MIKIKVHSLWIGEPLSTLEKLCIASHLQNNHEYHLWVYDESLDVPRGVILEDGNEILPESEIFCYSGLKEEGGGSVSAFSNLFRYKLLSERSVWWCDTDVVCLKPWKFDKPHVTATEWTKHQNIKLPTTCVFKIPREAAQYCYAAARRCDRENLKWGEIGPALFAKNAYSPENMVEPVVFCPINWNEYEKIFEPFEIPGESYGIHLWNEMWRRHGKDKDGSHRPDCLYERLKSKYLGQTMML
jgi:hypothetical protein